MAGGGVRGGHSGHHHGGNGRGGNGRCCGYHNRPRYLGNVDITDPTRTFTDDEYSELQENNHWSIIIALRDQHRSGGSNGQNNPPPCQVVGVVIPSQMSPITDNSQQNQQHQQPIPERGSQNGSGFGSSAYRNN